MTTREELRFRKGLRVETFSVGIPTVNGWSKVRVSDPVTGRSAEAEDRSQLTARAKAVSILMAKL